MQKDKKRLRNADLDKDIDKYFTALMNEKHLGRVSDASYVNFLLDQIPSNLTFMNNEITSKMLAKEAEDPQIVEEMAKKESNQKKLREAKN